VSEYGDVPGRVGTRGGRATTALARARGGVTIFDTPRSSEAYVARFFSFGRALSSCFFRCCLFSWRYVFVAFDDAKTENIIF
jgi:hypothetical protein